ncbi:MAG: antitermination protein NusB [Bacteroidetes bacterium HGW-Bacteroidetes-6]|jgi:hypothetical protein|nr:MAG: antitermination protein NusB [Bacteroidetes bacterium HGW-Bacteroidetes-6]
MKEFRFKTTILKQEKIDAAYIEFPFDVQKEFGKKGQVKVKAYFDGFEYRGSLVKMGHPCHIIGLNKQVRDAIGKGPGDEVDVIIVEDTEERIVEVPSDLQAALNTNPEAKAVFEKMSYSHKREYVEAILEAKKPETRISRIAKCIATLQSKIKK